MTRTSNSKTIPTIGQSDIWAITSYFNPAPYKSRLHNFRIFRQYLRVPLVTVELGYEDRFELQPSESDILVQLNGCDVLWQKERLLNIALANVPQHVQFVAWLDCDVILERVDWPQLAMEMLQRSEIVQLFSELHDLGPHALPPALGEQDELTGLSVAHLIESGSWSLNDLRPSADNPPRQVAFGLAWAARRSLLEQHGFYDAMVLGSGDRAIACAAYGRFDNPIEIIRLNESRVSHYLDWAEPFYRDVRGSVGCVDGKLYHLWHGDPKLRRYRERHKDFAAFDFDPSKDILIDRTGVLRWAENRPELAEFGRCYFTSRLEDGDYQE